MGSAHARCALAVVEAAYRLEGEVDDWLRHVVRASEPRFDQGLGVCACTMGFREDGTWQLTSTFVTNGRTPPPVLSSMMAINTDMPAGEGALLRRAPALHTASEIFERSFGTRLEDAPRYRQAQRVGVYDWLAAKAVDSNGTGVGLVAPLPATQRVRRREVARWRSVMTHLLSALRLRRAVEAPDAVLDPGGRVVHADGAARAKSAREALRERARQIDRARSRAGRRDPDATLAAWKGLVSGRWSLIDRFESDGRRYLIARPNQPAVGPHDSLTPRERHVLAYAALGYSNQAIAYALGLAPSTISTHLVKGMRRLGCRDRAALAEMLSPRLEPSA